MMETNNMGQDIRKFTVEVTQTVEVQLDAAKFDQAFMSEFRESFYPFFDFGDHAEHLAQLQARGVCELDARSGEFVEGYGPSKDMGIRAEVLRTDIEIVDPLKPEEGE